MRTTIVPAQITTVEDKIAGNLTMTQIFLLLIPVFFGSIVYLMFPPQLHFSVYKIVLMFLVVVICCTLAIRIKGKVIIQWIAILLRYNNRPRYYIANKNENYLRELPYEFQAQQQEEVQHVIEAENTKQKHELSISFPDIFKLEQFIAHPKSKMRFKFAKKGKLYVTLSEIK